MWSGHVIREIRFQGGGGHHSLGSTVDTYLSTCVLGRRLLGGWDYMIISPFINVNLAINPRIRDVNASPCVSVPDLSRVEGNLARDLPWLLRYPWLFLYHIPCMFPPNILNKSTCWYSKYSIEKYTLFCFIDYWAAVLSLSTVSGTIVSSASPKAKTSCKFA